MYCALLDDLNISPGSIQLSLPGVKAAGGPQELSLWLMYAGGGVGAQKCPKAGSLVLLHAVGAFLL